MKNKNDFDWLSGGGEMGKLIRSMDWSKNSLGPIENWSQSLKTAVSLCLSSTFPINIVWGPDHIQIYNDSYRPICGGLHPASMGSKFKECWASALPVVGGAFDSALNGEGTYIPNQRMFLERYGYLEEAFMTFSFSPIRDEEGKVGGIFHPISESTEKMLSSRRTQVIRDLAIQVNKAKNLSHMYELASNMKDGFELDLPFTVFFEVNKTNGKWTYQNSFGLKDDSPLLNPGVWNLDEIKTLTLEKGLLSKFSDYKSGPYEKAPDEALLIPVFTPGAENPLIVMVSGVSSARDLDEDYRSFFELFRNTLTTAVTNILAYEEEQKRAEALAQIDKAKTAFFSNVSHEFRTPLTLILGPLEDSLTDSSHPLTPVQKERQEVIHRNAQRLLKLVNSLLDFSRIEAGRMQAAFVPVDLAQFTTDIASIFRSTIEKEKITFNVQGTPLPESIYIDKEMWEKIILNLLSNAFKFTFEGEISVSSFWDGKKAVVEVKDTGIGVSEEEVPRLFERFHRVQGAKSRTYEGTGIGLALVKELVHMHGGDISVKSEFGKGTTFRIELPPGTSHLHKDKISHTPLQSTAMNSSAYLQEAQMWTTKEDDGAQDTLTTLAKEVVLLADDNADMRSYVAQILGSRWQVVTAKDGQEAYDLAQRLRPDLILTDVMMPVLDGFGLLDKLRHHPEFKLTPVVLLSARAGEEAKLEGLDAGADDYLVKPFSARELLSRVEALLKITKSRFHVSDTLKEDAKKFRSTFSHASVNIAMIDLNGMILEINEAFLIKTGFKLNEVVGKHFSEFTHPEDLGPNIGTIEKLKNGEQFSSTFDKRYIKKDGSYFWVRTSISSSLGEDQKPLYLIAVSQDIEAIKEAEENYQKAVSNLEEEKELREQFVATLTHDLRSPMTSAKMSAQLIQKKPENQETVQDQAARIVRSVNRADQMIEDLLDANRIRAGEKIPLEIESFNLMELIRANIDNFISLQGNRFKLSSNVQLINGYWSFSGLYRALENLVNNAVKYGDPKTDISISVTKKDQSVEVSVHNYGNPISHEELTHIFNPYRRLKSADSGTQRGWGLGLTLVKGVIEALGGKLHVESLPESGTIFLFQIPIDSRNYYENH